MGFLGARVGSRVIKNMNEFLKFQSKVEQCSTFEGKKNKIQFGDVEKMLYCPDCFFKNIFG
jgi:hypothetical protein